MTNLNPERFLPALLRRSDTAGSVCAMRGSRPFLQNLPPVGSRLHPRWPVRGQEKPGRFVSVWNGGECRTLRLPLGALHIAAGSRLWPANRD
jgi:hypothetical protein